MAYYKRLASGKLARRTDGKRAKTCSATTCNDPWVKWHLGQGPPGNIGKALSVTVDASMTLGNRCEQTSAFFNLVSYGTLWTLIDINTYASGAITYCFGTAVYQCVLTTTPTTVAGKPCVDITSSITMRGENTTHFHSNGAACCLAGGGSCGSVSFTTTPYTLSASACSPETGLFRRIFSEDGVFTFVNGVPGQPFPIYCTDFAPVQVVTFPTNKYLDYSIIPTWVFPPP